VRRIVVAGSRGFFGSAVLQLLRAGGRTALAASRRPGADVRLDVDDRASIRAALRAGDIVVDASAPFQTRTMALVEEAIAHRFDVVDLCDSLAYARAVHPFDAPAREAGVRILNCCSAMSVMSAFALEQSGHRAPVEIHGFLAPATRYTSNPGAVDSFLRSVGTSIDVWREGRWTTARGWIEAREFRGVGRGHAIESADSHTLPRAYPTLRTADFWVNPNAFGGELLIAVASRLPALMPLFSQAISRASWLGKLVGRTAGCLAYEVGSGGVATVIFRGPKSFRTAALPAAMAAEGLSDDRPLPAGVVPVNQHVPFDELREALGRLGIEIVSLAGTEAGRVQ
jgi:hypothetical protein